jgi:hypothetical protein
MQPSQTLEDLLRAERRKKRLPRLPGPDDKGVMPTKPTLADQMDDAEICDYLGKLHCGVEAGF